MNQKRVDHRRLSRIKNRDESTIEFKQESHPIVKLVIFGFIMFIIICLGFSYLSYHLSYEFNLVAHLQTYFLIFISVAFFILFMLGLAVARKFVKRDPPQ